MEITSVRVTRVHMPRIDPTWRTATYAGKAVEGFALEVAAGGVVGIGGTAAHVSQIGGDDLEAQLCGPVSQALLGADVLAGNRVREALRAARVAPRAALAADLALHDLTGKLAGLPCYAIWGGAVRSEVRVVRMVGIKPLAELEAAAGAMVEQGFTHLKVKIGTGLAEDVERIRLLRRVFGNAIWIGVDGNDAYTPDEAIQLCRELEPFDVGVIEQPVDRRDIDGLARVTAASAIPIMADQCVYDVASALAVCERRAAHMVSLKATKMGSIEACRRVAGLCLAFGLRVHIGGSVAPSVVDAAQAHLAVSLPGIEEECEVGEFLAVAGDPVQGVTMRNGKIELDMAPGLGVALASASAR